MHTAHKSGILSQQNKKGFAVKNVDCQFDHSSLYFCLSENVLLAPVNLYRSAATVYGGLSVVAGENAGGKTKKGN